MEAGWAEEDDLVEPMESYVAAPAACPQVPSAAMVPAACPQVPLFPTQPNLAEVSAMEVLELFDLQTFWLDDIFVTTKLSYDGTYAWVALYISTIRSEKWIANDVYAHVTMTYLRKEAALKKRDQVVDIESCTVTQDDPRNTYVKV